MIQARFLPDLAMFDCFAGPQIMMQRADHVKLGSTVHWMNPNRRQQKVEERAGNLKEEYQKGETIKKNNQNLKVNHKDCLLLVQLVRLSHPQFDSKSNQSFLCILFVSDSFVAYLFILPSFFIFFHAPRGCSHHGINIYIIIIYI